MKEIDPIQMSIYDINSEWYGVPRYLLMENAGTAIARKIKEILRDAKDIRISVFCGTGGNGGDGMVVARHLYNDFSVSLFLLGNPDRISSLPAKNNWKSLQKLPNLSKSVIRDSRDIDKVDWKEIDIVIEGLLGSGLKSSPRNPHAVFIDKFNTVKKNGLKIWSIDVPSGLLKNGEFGKPIVDPDIIFALHQAKTGTHKFSNAEIYVLPIGIPKDAINGSGPGYLATIPTHPKSSHKGDNGKVLLIGGSIDFHGAPILAGLAALKAGIDLLTIIAPVEIAPIIRSASPEFIVHPLAKEYFTTDQVPDLIDMSKTRDVVLLGPGIGQTSDTKKFVQEYIRAWTEIGSDQRPGLVIDADALKALQPITKLLTENVIITPHAGEFASITGKTLPSGNSSLSKRIDVIRSISGKIPAVWLVKGQVDIIAHQSQIIQNHTGCPEMTIGGTGDVLAGVTSGIYARTQSAFRSAVASAFWVGLTGEYLLTQKEGFSTMQIVDMLPVVWNELQLFIKEKPNVFS